MQNELLQKLADRVLTREELLQKAKQDFGCFPKCSTAFLHQEQQLDTVVPSH